MYGSTLDGMFAAFIAVVVVITAAVTALLIFGVPWLWQFIKPWLHALTA